jgi:hypothetical protein
VKCSQQAEAGIPELADKAGESNQDEIILWQRFHDTHFHRLQIAYTSSTKLQANRSIKDQKKKNASIQNGYTWNHPGQAKKIFSLTGLSTEDVIDSKATSKKRTYISSNLSRVACRPTQRPRSEINTILQTACSAGSASELNPSQYGYETE